jgi:EAL domain-containing protein (putative c-di-GMP-specific phosphodiesterase class I)
VTGRDAPGEGDVVAIRESLDARRFGIAYEPIVEVTTGARCAYEALARFHRRDGSLLPSGEVFAWLHADAAQLAEVECALKAFQVERAPAAPLFVNVDPDSYTVARERGLPILAPLAAHGDRVVVEVVESTTSTDAGRIRRAIRDLREHGIGVALDDLGAPNALVSLESLLHADFLKLDRSLVSAIVDRRYRNLVECLVALARKSGARTVLEGVERPGDLAVAEALQIDLVQGYLFRDDFITVGAPRAAPRRRSRRGAATSPDRC